MEEILPKVQFNLLNSSAYYRYLSRRIGAIVETTLSALKYQGTYSKFMPKHFETSFRRKPRTNDELIAQTLTTTQGIPIILEGKLTVSIRIQRMIQVLLISLTINPLKVVRYLI